MKKETIIIVILCLTTGIVFSQAQLTFRFTNAELSGSPAVMAFDVEVKANVAGTFHRDLQLYINYNPEGFGANVVANNTIQLTNLELMTDNYQVVNLVDNTHSKLAIITEALYEMTEPGSADYFTEIPQDFTGLFHVEISISDPEQLAGIGFDAALMDGGQYFQDTYQIAPLAYLDPCMYDNDLMDFLLHGHALQIPEGWSGISSYMNPQTDDVESMFGSIIDDLIILQNPDGVYWPVQNVNTLGPWNTHTGYQIKVANAVELLISGTKEIDKSLQLATGWNLIPVISACNVDVEELFSGTNLVIVKEVAGSNTYWPEYGINTLVMLEPGKAYFTMMGNEEEITFPDCNMTKDLTLTRPQEINLSAFEIKKTTSTHTIAIPTHITSGFPADAVLSAQDAAGNLFGAVALQGSTNVLTIFGDDPLTREKDGFMEGEQIYFYSSLPESKIRELLDIALDPSLPESDGAFTANGLSSIKAITAVTSEVNADSRDEIRIYPNPVSDFLHVDLGAIKFARLQIRNMKGQMVDEQYLTTSQTTINIAHLPRGIYYFNVEYNSKRITGKLVLH